MIESKKKVLSINLLLEVKVKVIKTMNDWYGIDESKHERNFSKYIYCLYNIINQIVFEVDYIPRKID